MTVSVVEGRRELAVVRKRTICIDEVVDFLSAKHYGERYNLLPVHWTARWLQPISSHVWFLDENYERVVKYCAAALAAIAATQNDPSAPPRKIVESLAIAMLDRYGHDRASYVSSHLSDHPALQAKLEIPRQVDHDGRTSSLWQHELGYSGITPKVADRVAEMTSWAVPDSFFELSCVDTGNPVLYAVLYADYGGWCIKVAEYQ